MDLINKTLQEHTVNKPDIEQIEREKQEWKLLGTFMRRKGLSLYSYNPIKNIVKEIKPKTKNDLKLIVDNDGKLTTKDESLEEVNVDSRNIHFEALNYKNALKRVQKYKNGTLEELCNLRKPIKNIDIFKF